MSTQTNILEVKRKTISGVASYFIRTAILQTVGLAAAAVLSAFLNPEDFGIYGFVMQLIGLMVFFSDVGLAAALIQKKAEPTIVELRTAFSAQQLLAWFIVAVIGGLVALGVFTEKIGTAGEWVLLSLAISFPLASLKTIPSIILERKLEFNKLVLPQIVEQLAFNGLLIYLAWNNYGVISYAYAILVRSILGVIVMYFIQSWSIGVSLNRVALRGLLQFGIKFQLNDLLARVKDQLFYLLLGWYLPLREFGYMQWAKNWSMYPYNLTVQNIMAVTFPTFSRLQDRKDLLKKAIEKSIFFISTAIFPLLIGMVVFLEPILSLVPRYGKWQPAVFSFVLFTLSIAWSAISTPLVNTLNAIGEINQSLKLMTLWTVLTWVLTPLFLWWFGFNGVAMAAFLISFTSILPVRMVQKIVQVDIWGQVKLALIASLLMAVAGIAGRQVWQQSGYHLLLGVLCVGVVYCLGLLVFGKQKLLLEVSSLWIRKK
jgi:O-antigen/teichoic acid export membrane protein